MELRRVATPVIIAPATITSGVAVIQGIASSIVPVTLSPAESRR